VLHVGTLVADIYEPTAFQGTAVLFVHGFGSSRLGTKGTFLGPFLSARGCRVILPDLQGHGDSGGSLGQITIDRSISDVRAIAAATGFDGAPRRILLGSSFGGLVAAWLCAEDPGFCDRAVLIAPALGFVERHVAGLSSEVAKAWRHGEPLHVEKDWFSVDLENAILKESATRPVSELARRLRTPTLIIHGDQDEEVPVSASVDFEKMCAAVDLHIIEGGDHRLAEHLERIAGLVV
jgi:pimeloyl-ACP methyl ester carboxylesterase